MRLFSVVLPGAVAVGDGVEEGAKHLDRFVKLDKGDFIGRDALVAAQGAGPERRLLTWTVDTAPGRDGADVIGDEPVWYDGDVVGWITSGGYSHHMDTSVAMGYVPAGLAGASGDSRSRSSASDMPLRSSTAVSGTPKANE